MRRRAGKEVDLADYLVRFRDLADQVQSVFAENRAVVDTSVSHDPATLATKLSTESPTADPPLPVVIGRFQVTAKIGEGAFGVVLQARDAQLDRDVAIKLPRSGALQADVVGGKEPSIAVKEDTGKPKRRLDVEDDIATGIRDLSPPTSRDEVRPTFAGNAYRFLAKSGPGRKPATAAASSADSSW